MRALAIAVVLASCATSEPAKPVVIAPSSPSALATIEASRDLDGAVIGATDAPTVVIVLASWCEHCRDELHVFDAVRTTRPRIRFLGVNYKDHEDYDHRGSSAAVRAMAREVPWLRIVPADDALFTQLGRPPLIPAIYVYRSGGVLAASFDRRQRTSPDAAELGALLDRL